MRAGLSMLIIVVFLASLAGCGSSEESGAAGGSSGDASAGCLSPAEVSVEVDRIAGGFETSQADVEAKQSQIRAIQAESC